jgi:hypothetical protein
MTVSIGLDDFTIEKNDDQIRLLKNAGEIGKLNISGNVTQHMWHRLYVAYNSTGTFLAVDDTNTSFGQWVDISGTGSVTLANSKTVIDELLVTNRAEDITITEERPVVDESISFIINNEAVLQSDDSSIDFGHVVMNANSNIVYTNVTFIDKRLMSPVIAVNISVVGGNEYQVFDADKAFYYRKTFSYDAGLLGPGPNQIVIKALDSAGNLAQKSVTVYVDRQGPSLIDGTVSFITPEGSPDDARISVYGTDINISMSVSDVFYTSMTSENNWANISFMFSGPSTNLNLWCPFNRNLECHANGPGTITTVSVESNNETGYYTRGPNDYALKVKDGVGLNITVGDYIDVDKGAISWMFRKNGTITHDEILFNSTVFSATINSSGFMNIMFSNITYNSSVIVDDSRWYDVLVSWAKDQVKIIFNNTVTMYNGYDRSFVLRTIDIMPGTNSTSANVSIDDLKIFNDAQETFQRTIPFSEVEKRDDEGKTFFARYRNQSIGHGIYELETGHHSIEILLYDKYNNTNSLFEAFEIQDIEPPKYSIVFDCKGDSNCERDILVRSGLVANNYTVNLTASEPLNFSVFNLTYSFSGREDVVELRCLDTGWQYISAFGHSKCYMYNGTVVYRISKEISSHIIKIIIF